MPYQTLRLVSGVNVSETPTLNEAGISASQLVRYKPDPKGTILVEKIGGWVKFYAQAFTSVVRAMFAWEDTSAIKWIALGTADATAAQLTVIQCRTNVSGFTKAGVPSYTITPQYLALPGAINFQTTAGSSVVTITDNSVTGLTSYDNVFLSTPVSVGGIILSGLYAITQSVSTNIYTINAMNVLGTPAPAAYATVATPLTVTAGVYASGPPATLALTYAAQATAPFPVGSNVNITGIDPSTWNGSCIVTGCTITQVTVVAPVGASGTWNSGGSLSNYGVVPILTTSSGSTAVTVTFPDHGQTPGSNFSILNESRIGPFTLYGNYLVSSVADAHTFSIGSAVVANSTVTSYLGAFTIVGGASTTTAVTLIVGQATFHGVVIPITGGSSTTTHVTLSWDVNNQYTFTVGTSVYVSGINPGTWNGSFIVTSSTVSSVTYALVGSALPWVSGGTVQRPILDIGNWIQVSGINPSTWNGNYTVTSATASSVTYALSGSALSWVAGGVVGDIGGDETVVYSIAIGPLPPTSGWGVGTWGGGGWGTGLPPTQVNGLPISATNWALDNWGELLLAQPIGFSAVQYRDTVLSYSPISVWAPSSRVSSMTVLSNGPSASAGFFVAMPQRQIIAWGTTFAGVIDPLLIRWCDVSNFNVWVGTITNQAGSYRVSTGSAIIGGMQANNQGLIWTDIGLWSMQYIGAPYVYSFNQLAQGCGLISRRAAGVMNGVVFWMGSQQFFTYSANGVQPIVCPIWDAVFQQLDHANVDKITIAINSLFEEVKWYYPIIGGNGECTNYVRFSTLTNMWDLGSLGGRSAWIDNSVLGPPIGFDPVSKYVYQHEIGRDADGTAINSSFTTGYFSIADGQNKVFIDEVWPDFKYGFYNQAQKANIQITFNVVDFPGDTPTTYGPYNVVSTTQWFNTRIRARLMSITISSNDLGTFWRTGAFRYRASIDGRY